VEVDEEDTEQGGDFGQSFLVKQYKYEKDTDADDLDGGAVHHTVREIENEVDEIAPHCQYNESIEPPEAGLWVPRRGWCFLVLQLGLGNWIYPKIWQIF